MTYHFHFSLLDGLVVLVVLAAGVVALVDVSQKKHAIRHNFPLFGWGRYILESQRQKIQQYFIQGPRDEKPYNLRQREFVYRAAKDVPTAMGFGSDADLDAPGAYYFIHSAFPTLDEEAPDAPNPPVIGPHRKEPFQPRSFFNISDMSYGSLGRTAVEALSHGAAASGLWLSTGEGSLAPAHKVAPCDRVLEIGTAMFGVRELDGTFSLPRLKALCPDIRAITLKLSQGAKPGGGGILPKSKITPEIAQIRNIPLNIDCHSPNRFKEFDDVPSMMQFIALLQEETGKPVGVKFCLGERSFVRELAAEIAARPAGAPGCPDYLILDGSEGGTGAAPLALADTMGTPIRQSLPWVDDLLREFGIRDRVRLIAAGKFAMASEVAFALALGADYVNQARAFLFAIGCIQAQQCHTNRCPTGITTHDKFLMAGLDPLDKGQRVANYAKNLRKELMMIVRSCGLRSPAELSRRHVMVNGNDGQAQSLAALFPRPAASGAASSRAGEPRAAV